MEIRLKFRIGFHTEISIPIGIGFQIEIGTRILDAIPIAIPFDVRTGRDLSLRESDVFIIDTIGILTKIYSYADIAYVGGGFGNPGVHNILEPATFGIPIIIGPNYSHFAEATALVNMDGCISISNQKEMNEAFENLIHNEDIRAEKGHICSTFVQMNKGATAIILKHIS